MWHMVYDGDIRATFEIVEASESRAVVNGVDDYTFRATGRKVHNIIESRFRLLDHSIVDQHDVCDARQWTAMALGGASGLRGTAGVPATDEGAQDARRVRRDAS